MAFTVFRADNMQHAFTYFSTMFSATLFQKPEWVPKLLIVTVAAFMLIEWLGREQQYAIAKLGYKLPVAAKYAFYYSLMLAIYYFARNEHEFIYFHF